MSLKCVLHVLSPHQGRQAGAVHRIGKAPECWNGQAEVVPLEDPCSPCSQLCRDVVVSGLRASDVDTYGNKTAICRLQVSLFSSRNE